MRLQRAFFPIGFLIMLAGLIVNFTQRVQYQIVLFEKQGVTNWLSDESGQLYANTFNLSLSSLELQNYPSGNLKSVSATLSCCSDKETTTPSVSTSHPARYHQYWIYLKDYWPPTQNMPAGVRLLLVEQPGSGLVFAGLFLLIVTSLGFSASLLLQFARLAPHRAKMLLYVLVGLVGATLLLLNPMLRHVELPPILRSVWFLPHVLAFVLSYVFVFLSVLFAFSQSYQNLFNISFWLGTIFCTLGMTLGMIWAYFAWGHFWNWDPKECAALPVWLFSIAVSYAFTSKKHCQSIVYKRIFSLIALLLILFCWLGVRCLNLGGLHIYQ